MFVDSFSLAFRSSSNTSSLKAAPIDRAIKREKSTNPLDILLIVYTPFANLACENLY
jgi:hypothetical protein